MKVVRRDELKPFVTKDGSEIREFHRSENLSLAEASVPVGMRTRKHFHKTSEEIYFILEGRGVMEVEGERAEVAAGQAIVIPPGKAHCIENVGDVPLRFLCHCSPPYSHEDTVLVE
ncbi:MAG: Mannose-6-phosphate isomerase [Candidatus Alkanophagales archaeon MCA70_species_1]|nr:Mannose-6-phosphate isomerase [Candidatus Alkanophaga volatiphilum]